MSKIIRISSIQYSYFPSSDNQSREFVEELLARADADQSDAISLGTISTIFSVGVPIVTGIIDHFKNSGSQQQSRELEALFARADIDETGALSFGDLKNIASIGGSAISIIHNLFSGYVGVLSLLSHANLTCRYLDRVTISQESSWSFSFAQTPMRAAP